MPLISWALTMLLVLAAVAFFTLFERKGLSYFQLRKGPNKVSLIGVLQPIADAVKLMSNQYSYPSPANKYFFFLTPALSLGLAFLLWALFPLQSKFFFVSSGLVFIICVSSLSVYGTLLLAWTSNSKYSILGGLRSVAQTISYEITMVLVVLTPTILTLSFNLEKINSALSTIWMALLFLPAAYTWFMIAVAETNRAPFDFAEGESELVSGFNVEYSGGGFAVIFLAEYANIILMSMIMALFFLGGTSAWLLDSDLILIFKTVLFCFLFIWLRASYPRLRYDYLMMITWKMILPFSLALLMTIMTLLFLTHSI
uniref:NADH-ubiquinone oxidoreductase chain 1 n=1 Tax=Laevipilina antarctica TaxID=358449 RepID=A0A1L6BZX7_9MOLL|nr:NADH dehydrogenase subunit 1 [Laevipilina antarctica]APQ42958.1 NADH dehydrogenase subunit 1 [Laevipilina antarctica]